MKVKRNIVRKVRLTVEEDKLFRQKSERFRTVAAMIRDAVRQFDDVKIKGKLEILHSVKPDFEKCEEHLGKLGGNFNQYMHRANELCAAGDMNQDFFKTVCTQAIETQKAILQLKDDFEKVYAGILKL